MGKVNRLPSIPDDWKGSRAEASRLLGISPKTLDKYITMAEQSGMVVVTRSWFNGRIQYTGLLIKQLWIAL